MSQRILKVVINSCKDCPYCHIDLVTTSGTEAACYHPRWHGYTSIFDANIENGFPFFCPLTKSAELVKRKQ